MGYIKLKGHEKPTPDSERRAKSFIRWYSLRIDTLRKDWLYVGKYDDEVATDTALYIYDCIALKGLRITGKYKFYFLRAYHMRLLAENQKKAVAAKRFIYLDDPDVNLEIAASDFECFEKALDALNTEMMDYVRANYSALESSLFEIYIALQPDMSYKRLGKMLGYSPNKIWPIIGAIRRDLCEKFAARRAAMPF
jgi:hypothetical protein